MITNGEVIEIPSEELVIGDRLMIEEVTLISVDGMITYAADFSLNESILKVSL